MSEETIVASLCRIPLDFNERDDISVIALLAESGYLSNPNGVTTAVIEKYLRDHPGLIDAWPCYSADERCLPTYFLDVPEDRTPGRFIGGWLGEAEGSGLRREEKEFPDSYKACAYYIKVLAEHWRPGTCDVWPHPLS